ncbi:vanin-like protein 3 [Hetaerina americana]|uniref:vanin-like protein 3 n=1 Tax=Hetaerina americana TaxID=62018 RepID=UPI003A7F5D5B
MSSLIKYLAALLLLLSCTDPSRARTSYTAAVVEYHPVDQRGNDSNFVLNANLAEYEKFIEEAKGQNADIVVFPEYGLTGLGASNTRKLALQYAQTVPPAPKHEEAAEVPCLSPNSSMAIRRLSCSSRKNKIYVVVNLPEVVPCNLNDLDCPEDGFYIYNTNVVFDRDGGVISKYHKYNLYLEKSMNKPQEPMYSTFQTDFSVTFGVFICFDILFKEPAFNLVKVMKVKNLIFSTAWISQLPFLTAVQTQESWAFGLDVNLLASGLNHPEAGNGGSGIYAGGKGRLASIMPSTSGSQLIITQVPLMQRVDAVPDSVNTVFQYKTTNSVSHMHLRHDDLSNYTFSQALVNGSNDIKLCNRNLCCNFHADVQFSDDGHEAPIYRFATADTQIKYGHTYKANIHVCALLYCEDVDETKCVYYPDDPQSLDNVNFKSIEISGNFLSSQMIFPSTLATSLEPLPVSSLSFMKNDDETTLQLTKDSQGLLTFALYARNFNSSTFEVSTLQP